MQHHVIHVQTLEITAPDDTVAREAMDSFATLQEQTVLPLLEEVFDALVGDDELIRIDRLVVDLGAIAAERVSTGLADRLTEELGSVVSPLIGRARRGADDERSPDVGGPLGALREFLEHGILPWYAPAWVRVDPEGAFLDLMASRPAATERILRLASPRALERLVLQFSPATLHAAVDLLSPGSADALVAAVDGWLGLAATLDRPLPSRDQITAQALTGIVPSPRSTVPDLLDHLATTVGPLDPTGRTRRATRSIDRSTLDADVASWATERGFFAPPPGGSGERATADNDESRNDESGESDGKPTLPANESATPRTAKPGPTASPEPASIGRPAPLTSGNDLVPPDGSENTREVPPGHPTRGVSEPSPNAPDRADGSGPSADWPDVLGDAIYIENAGLVLLWPFLVSFFDAVGFLSEGRFADEVARGRAVQLLHQAVTGSSRGPEHQLMLNKLLCGWPLEQPIESELVLTEIERREVDELLQSAIDSWGALGSTSVKGLRSSFLQRAGRLTHLEIGWSLYVPREAFDVLLDRLPWGVGVVALPWMTEPLVVEW